MRIYIAHRSIRVVLGIAVLASSGLACLTNWDPIDEAFFPEEYAAQKAHEESLQFMREMMKIGQPAQPQSDSGAPQGEFVPPVAPVAPQVQPAAPAAEPPAAAPASGAPVILSTYFPSPIPADGQGHYGWISFTDPDGDVASLKIEIVWTTAPVKGKGDVREAEIEGPPTAGKVRMGFT